MKYRKLIISSIILLTVFVACGKGSDDHGEHSMKSMHQALTVDGVMVSVEMSSMKAHAEMMKLMKMEMKHSHSGDHYVMLTLMSEADSSLLRDVKELIFDITGPDGKVITKKAHVMSNDSMYHLGADFNASGDGEYIVKITFKHAAKDYSPQVKFKM